MYRFVLLAVVASAVASNVDNRIVGGKQVTIEEYPHQVSLKNVKGAHFCGGAIVNNQFVLTAAHCMARKNLRELSVRIGTAHRRNGGVKHQIKEVKTHPSFFIGSLDYDISILRIMEPIQFNAAAQPVSIVIPSEAPHVGDMLFVSGWGMTQYAEGNPTLELRAVRVPLVDRKLCVPVYKKKALVITERMICAGGGKDTGAYRGDSGGALVNQNKQLVGIVSWGLNSNITGYPGVYADVAHPEIWPFIKNETAVYW